MADIELARITEALIRRYGLRVLTGPFAGMAYVGQAVGSALVPKLLGSYERELHTIWAQVTKNRYGRIVNIGCGEGYYAVGLNAPSEELRQALPLFRAQHADAEAAGKHLARSVAGATVFAFDPDPVARELCVELARVNSVAERLIIAGNCGLEELQAVANHALVVCDCEGCETELLQPDFVPALSTCELLVELHDFLDSSISGTIRERFARTHQIEVVESTERDPSLFDSLIRLIDATEDHRDGSIRLDFSEEQKQLALAEFRPPAMRWAFMTPT